MNKNIPIPFMISLLILFAMSAHSQHLSVDSTLYKNTWDNRNSRTTSIITNGTYRLALNPENENSFVFPCRDDAKVCSNYGIRGGRLHTGMDIKLNYKDSIYAAWDGVVRMAKTSYYGYGAFIVIRHNNGLETFYAHLSKVLVAENQEVKAGDLIGLAGRTGRATTEHLHFETRFLYEPMDPRTIIDFSTNRLKADSLIVRNKKFYGIQVNDTLAWENEVSSDTSVTAADSLTLTDSTKNTVAAVQPTPSKTPASKPNYHIVAKGNTLSYIAKRYGVSVKELCRLNNMKETDILSIGRKIKLR